MVGESNMKFAQIVNGKAHWIFEADKKPSFHPSIVLVDISDRDDIKEGWDYSQETGEFTEPVFEEVAKTHPTLEEIAEENLLETKYQTLILEMML